jgi:hypothetical protein
LPGRSLTGSNLDDDDAGNWRESAHRIRLEDDPETGSRCPGEAREDDVRWTHGSTLDPRDVRLRCVHTSSELQL